MKQKLTLKQTLMAGVKASGVSIVLNVILLYLLKSAGIFTDDIFIQPGQNLTILPVIISSIVPVLIAALVFFVIEKFTSKGFKIFTAIAVILFIASLVSPFKQIPNVTTGFAIGLDVMHLVVFSCVMYFFSKADQSINRE